MNNAIQQIASSAVEFSDLDALMSEGLALAAKEKEAKKAKAKLKDTRITKEERTEIESKVAEWENGREWLAQAEVAVFDVQACSCGSHHTHFRGIFQRQQHVRIPSAARFIKVDQHLNANLPKEKRFEQADVTVCARCISPSYEQV